ncbi:MAG: hypothetical protein WDN28_19595 [Chthoniobacter sp.]
MRPRDLAVVKIEAPDAVFFEDRISGQITLKDDLPAGIPFTVMVQDGDKVLWQQQLVSEGSNLRKIPFSFPLSESVQERLKNKAADTQLTSVPLELKVSVSNVEGDREPGNNTMNLRVRALTQKTPHPDHRWPSALGDAVSAQYVRPRRAVAGEHHHCGRDGG